LFILRIVVLCTWNQQLKETIMAMSIKSIPVLTGQTVKQRSGWMILDDQYFTFAGFTSTEKAAILGIIL